MKPPALSSKIRCYPIEFRHLFRQTRPALTARSALGHSGD
jgi:hypothetical protein